MSNAAPQTDQTNDKNAQITKLYDDVPYESYAYFHSHPDNLYTTGKLYGLTPPDFEKARILELGCASGGNLFPYAMAFPDSESVGVDLSSEQVREGLAIQEKLGVTNVRLETKDIMDITPEEYGLFDYIICHGMLSWVPDPVRNKIFELCRDQLTPEGMAFISYNVLPGWHMVSGIRDMMRLYTKDAKTPDQQVKKALSTLAFMTRNVPEDKAVYQHVLAHEDAILKDAFDDFILHDHISDFNKPLYLYEFQEKLEEYDLQYVSDSEYETQYFNGLGEEAISMINTFKTRVEKCQFRDFLCNQRFRTSIITRSTKPAKEKVDMDTVMNSYYTFNSSPAEENPDPKGPVTYCKHKTEQNTFIVTEYEANLLFLELHFHGKNNVNFEEIYAGLKEEHGITDTARLDELVRKYFPDLIEAGFVKIFAGPSNSTPYLAEKPKAYDYARLRVEMYPATKKLTNANRFMFDTEKFVNFLLMYMDGTRNMDEIETELFKHLEQGDFSFNDANGLKMTDPMQQKSALSVMVLNTANNLAEAGLLVE